MKRALIVMAILALTAVAAAVLYQAEARERDYRLLLAQGDAALAADQTFTAIESYSGAIALRPDSMLPHLRLGETYRQRGDLEAAASDFRKAAALDPSATRPLDQWGDVLYEQQRYARAAEIYDARLRLDDRSAAIRYRLALAQYRDGNLDGALASLRKAIALDERLAEAHYLMGLCFSEKGRSADAIAAFEKAIERNPSLIPAHEELADLYRKAGKSNDELQQLQVLATLDGDRLERRVALAMAHARAGHTDLAVLTLASALDQAPDQPVVYGALGRLWLELTAPRYERPDALSKALEALERAASAPSATSEIKRLYGQALVRDHQFDAAERVLQQATERFPADPGAFADYAAAAEQQQHLDAARQALIAHAALVDDATTTNSHALRIGQLSLRLNDLPTALFWLDRAALSTPDDMDTLTALAEAEVRSGQRDAAQRTIAHGLTIEPANQRLAALARKL